MDIVASHKFLSKHLVYDPGKFYFSGNNLSLGVGQIYDGLRYPVYNEESNKFDTLQGPAYVLTHECDVDQENNRAFNTDVLICPIIQFEYGVEQYTLSRFGKSDGLNNVEQGSLLGFLEKLAKREVSRLVYLPHYPPVLPYGGILFLNLITNTSVTAFELTEVERIASVTGYGLRVIDHFIENHLLRPKSERLALLQH